MKRLNYLLLITTLALALVLPASIAGAQEADDAVLELTGTLDGAPFKILVPANWNETLLIYAPGCGWWPEPTVSFPPVPVEEPLLAQGYAMAGSAFRSPAWSVEEGIQNTLALTGYFRDHVGNPERIILWGVSTGGLIAQASTIGYPWIYDAAITMCSATVGSTKICDRDLDLGLAYEAAFGWPGEWGSAGDDLSYWAAMYPLYEAQIGDPANLTKYEFMRLVDALPAGDLNVDAEILYTQMNSHRNVQAQRRARTYLERYADLSGEIVRPVLSMHTMVDSICAMGHESAYRETVAAAARKELLLQVYTDGIGHCAFTPRQMLAAFAAMEHWLDTGERPGASFFDPADGFLTFKPPSWPQPPPP
jgi:pimeloyl-ACP methyl ester carboxylesterase